jgi:hypothetical protein
MKPQKPIVIKNKFDQPFLGTQKTITKLKTFIMKNKIKTLLIVIIFSAIYFEIGYAQSKKELLPYLNNNKIDLTTIAPNWSTVFDENFYQNNVFLVGERHGIDYTYDAVWKLFVHLKEKTNFKYFLLEAPQYWEDNLNKYLETGKEDHLKETFFQAKGTFYANHSFYNFFKKVHEYNANLKTEDKIEFICIDVEHQYKHSHAMLLNTFKNHLKTKKDTVEFVKYFFKNDPEKTNQYKKAYATYQTKWNENKIELEKEFGSNHKNISYLIQNVNNKFLTKTDKKREDLVRDSLMYENFALKTKSIDLKTAKMFGFFGIDHVYMDTAKNAKYFASYLVQNKIKTTSFVMLYSNCETLIPRHYLPGIARIFYGKDPYFTTKNRSNDRVFEHQNSIGILKEASPNNITLFNLNAKNAPFQRNHIFIDELKSEKPTTNYLQYLFLIKDSPAAKMY